MGARDASTFEQWSEALERIYDAEGVPGVARRLARGLKREPAEVERELRDATYEHYAAALERTVRILDGSAMPLTGTGGTVDGSGRLGAEAYVAALESFELVPAVLSSEGIARLTAEAERVVRGREHLDNIEVRFYGRRDGLVVYEGTGTYRTGPTRYEPDPDDIFARDDSWWRNPWELDPTPRPRGLAALGYGMASEVHCG